MSHKNFSAPAMNKDAAAIFQEQGFYQAPQLIPDDLLDEAELHMDKVIACEYETGVAPQSSSVAPGDLLDNLVKINNAHIADRTLFKLVSYPLLGEWAAAVIGGAKRVQVWHTQLLYKPAGGSAKGNIGLHQDYNYWQFFANPTGVLTAWIALSDVAVESGAMRFVLGSHRWGLLDPGNFGIQDETKAKAGIKVPEGETWTEHPAVMPRGAVSFHHPMIFHGSGPNTSAQPRRSIAVHLCTEQSCLVEENPYVSEETLQRPEENPIIFGFSRMSEG
ncbi:MAG: phytanoyl-CoA dioxygenase family protein [Chloroflexota bacterium]